MRSSSTQPPDTEPMTWPSSRITSIAPTGRGAEPQVCTTVPRVARWPPSVHFKALRTTSRSRSEEHTSELQSLTNLVCRLLLEKKKNVHDSRRRVRSAHSD